MHQQLYIQITLKPDDGTVYEPKDVARNTTNTSNKLKVVYYYIIL